VEYSFIGYLPPNFPQQAAATLDSVALRPGENAVIRDIAACARLGIRSVPLTVPASSIAVTYTCGTRFNVTNSSLRGAMLRYRLQGTTDEWGLSVPAGGSKMIIATKSGTIEILQGADVVATSKNGRTGCS
jgi:hypothetical protein